MVVLPHHDQRRRQKGQERVIRGGSETPALQPGLILQGPFFRCQVGLQVDMCRLNALVAAL